MVDVNIVALAGRLTHPPELKTLPGGTSVCKLRVAINARFRGRDGELKEDTCFLDVDIFGRQAEACAQYLDKGRSIFVQGRLRQSRWKTASGESRSMLRVRAQRIQFLGDGRRSKANSAQAGPPDPDQDGDDQIADTGDESSDSQREGVAF
jgi:single-strand DNA-binding protein